MKKLYENKLEVDDMVMANLNYVCDWNNEEIKHDRVYRVVHVHKTINGAQVELENVRSSYPADALLKLEVA